VRFAGYQLFAGSVIALGLEPNCEQKSIFVDLMRLAHTELSLQHEAVGFKQW